MLTPKSNKLFSTAEELFRARAYQAAESVYQELIDSHPSYRPCYWKLGLSLLLQEREAEAQLCWMSILLTGEKAEVEAWTDELSEVLEAEAAQQLKQAKIRNSWLIRSHAYEVNPQNINNLLHLIQLCIKAGYSFEELLTGDQGLISLLKNEVVEKPNKELFLSTLSLILNHSFLSDEILLIVRLSFRLIHKPIELQHVLGPICIDLAKQGNYTAAAALAETHLLLEPDNMEFLSQIGLWHSNSGNLPRAIETASIRLSLSKTEIERIFSRHLLTKIFLGSGGHWEEAYNELKRNKASLENIVSFGGRLSKLQLHRLISTSFFTPYFQDHPAENRFFCNHIASLFSQEVSLSLSSEKGIYLSTRSENIKKERGKSNSRKLRIGYLSHCLRRHSVGWIARWLIAQHDHDALETYGYLLNFNQNDPFQNWYSDQFDQVCRIGIDCSNTGIEIAKRISDDKIDILIDLDSVTFDISCEVLAYKPAPIQVTWLGWDASGIPEIDYYIADPYVLPEGAQEYYQEKIWRLPKTYIAVGGFEVSTSGINRSSLGIPKHSTVFLTAQGGFKRNPSCIKMQLSAIKGVTDSYLIIKGASDSISIQKSFYDLANKLGIEHKRLIFLPIVDSEEEHRACLRIADIVLDTYPYNGATTTLETLWMEIPLVTLVGNQFSARNSYTMLKNVGVEEGIAWSEAEYIDWSIKLGQDTKLRQQVVWKLRESKKLAPLWDVKTFTEDMESSYHEMWDKYVSSINS